MIIVVLVHLLSCVCLFVTPWIAACQASLSIINSRSLPKLVFIELIMPSNIFCRPLLLLPPIPPSIRVFSNESTLRMRWQSSRVSALASFLPKNTQGRSPLEWTGMEKDMATHSSILAWRILWTEEPGGLQSMGSQRVGHD